MRKIISVLLVTLLAVAPLTLVAYARVDYSNDTLTNSYVTPLSFDYAITYTAGDSYDTLAYHYFGLSVIPNLRNFTSDSALLITTNTFTNYDGVYAPYGITRYRSLRLYRARTAGGYGVNYYVPRTICRKADLKSLPSIYVVTDDSFNNVHGEWRVLFTNGDIITKTFEIDEFSPYARYTTGSGSRKYYTVDIASYIYDQLDQLEDSGIINFGLFAGTEGEYVGAGIDVLLGYYTPSIYNTTSDYFNPSFATRGYEYAGSFVSSALTGLHRIMSTQILPQISLYTVFITALAIPTTIAILRRL